MEKKSSPVNRGNGCVLELAIEGQCDSSGHSATYSTVSAIDAETNKVISFSY